MKSLVTPENYKFTNNTVHLLIDEITNQKSVFDLLMVLYLYENKIILTTDEFKFINLNSFKFDEPSYNLWCAIKKQMKFITVN